MEELSSLADCMIEAALGRIRRTALEEGRYPVPRFCVLAFGKLGGRELNYSSDIDLLGLWEASGGAQEGEVTATSMMERLRSDLSDHTTGGYAYRVDLRLRPYGSSGQLVYELGALLRYYAEPAALWEQQALLKARPVAGDLDLGARFLESARATARRAQGSRSGSLVDRLAPARSHPGPLARHGRREGRQDRPGRDQGRGIPRSGPAAHPRPFGIRGSCGPTASRASRPSRKRASCPRKFRGGSRKTMSSSAGWSISCRSTRTARLTACRRIPEQDLALARRMLGAKATVEQFRAALDLRFENVHERIPKVHRGRLSGWAFVKPGGVGAGRLNTWRGTSRAPKG